MDLASLKELGVAGVALGANVYIVTYFLRHLKAVNEDHMKVWTKLEKKIDKDVDISSETLDLLRNLNGDLKKTIDKKRGR